VTAGLRRKPKGEYRSVVVVEAHGMRFRACDRWVSFTPADPGKPSPAGELRVFCGAQHVGWLFPDGDGWRWTHRRGLSGHMDSRRLFDSAEKALRGLAATALGRRIAADERRLR